MAEVRWVQTSPEFGSSWPNGCCQAFTQGTVCGWPRRADGTCPDGHPAQPKAAPVHSISDLRAAARVGRPKSGAEATS